MEKYSIFHICPDENNFIGDCSTRSGELPIIKLFLFPLCPKHGKKLSYEKNITTYLFELIYQICQPFTKNQQTILLVMLYQPSEQATTFLGNRNFKRKRFSTTIFLCNTGYHYVYSMNHLLDLHQRFKIVKIRL